MDLTQDLAQLGQQRSSLLLQQEDLALDNTDLRSELVAVTALSDFIFDQLSKNKGWLTAMVLQQLITTDLSSSFESRLQKHLQDVTDEQDMRRRLRNFRNFYLVVLAWQDLMLHFDISTIIKLQSELAEVLIVHAYHYVYEAVSKTYGVPMGEFSGRQQQMLIIGMGKLGGSELNFSSDIDLIFTYSEPGCTQGGRREIDNQGFFTKVSQQLIAMLNQSTADGIVYRVDMRLRPFGDDGQIVVSFNAMENYYIQHGRSWERYAMVKARVLGDYCPEEASELISMLRPFVYRRYFDFGAIDALRKMKLMIQTEIRRRGLVGNIKLGEGGIREVEFVTQVFQLMRGGREPELQQRNLKAAMGALVASEVISPETGDSLLKGYLFLRKLENLMQEIADKQTQQLPEDPVNRQRVACGMGLGNWDDLIEVLGKYTSAIHNEFKDVVRDQEQVQEDIDQVWLDIWRSHLTAEDVAPLLEEYVSQESSTFARLIVDFRRETIRRAMGPLGRETLNLLMPRVLSLVVSYDDPMLLFTRIAVLIRSIVTRTTYLQLLTENHTVLDQVVYLCNASARIAEQLSAYPILMDELIYKDSLYQITADTHKLKSELRQFMLRIEDDDLEQKMETLRQFKQIQLLKISASDIVGQLPLMRVSDFLTELAEAILAEVINIAWQEQSVKYGVPPYAQSNGERGLIAVAYGKLGGIELGYGSDLDLVFLHYPCEVDEMTCGEHPITVKKFYVRLVQRIIHLFSIRTSTGILYDVDLRLRPDGDSGLLVSSISAFERYQKHDAWTWEHQALVRARVIYGESAMAEQFYRIRREVLSQHRDLDKLKNDVVTMRDKMRNHLNAAKDGEFDLKQGAGGMVDIEFIAQFYVLAYAQTYPDILTKWSDNVRIFDSCVECTLMSPEVATSLKQAYIDIRNEAHKCSLREVKRVVKDDQKLQDNRRIVSLVWQKIFVENEPADRVSLEPMR